MKKRMTLLLLVVCFLFSSVSADAYDAAAVLPENLTTIESRAFEGTDIRELRIPQSVTQIADDAFEGLPEDFTAIVDENSYADFWCAEHGVRALRICSLGVTYHSQDEIREYVSSHPSDRYFSTGYRLKPSVSEPYSYGLLSDETISNTFNMLNQCRFIAGLDADVVNDTEYEKLVNAAALVNALNDSLTHYPERPDQLSDAKYDELYQQGATGARSSNLSAGMWALPNSVLRYLDDSDAGNIKTVGHRRWVLNPRMGKTAFGYCQSPNAKSVYRVYSGMYAFDRSGSGNQKPVAWPAQEMPLDYIYSNQQLVWSVSFGRVLSESDISVSLTRQKDGRVWHFSSEESDGDFYVNNGGFGLQGCVIFRPAGNISYSDGDDFQVEIVDYDAMRVLNYTVRFFKL